MDFSFIERFLNGTWTTADLYELAKVVGGVIGVFASALPIVRWWYSRTAVKNRLLEKFLLTEKSGIVDKRSPVLERIQISPDANLELTQVNINEDIDHAIAYLDKNEPDKASGALKELLVRIENKKKIEDLRLDLLARQKAAVSVFIAAIADRKGKPEEGLRFITDALLIDSSDKEALKYQGLLLLGQDQPQSAVNSFSRLLGLCKGDDNAKLRGEANALLGSAYLRFDPKNHEDARICFKRALNIIKRHPDNQNDFLIRGRVLEGLGDIAMNDPQPDDASTPIELYKESRRSFSAVKTREGVEGVKSLDSKIASLTSGPEAASLN